MRALIVEDTLINQEFLKMILEGWDCVVVESGEDGVEAFTSALEEETPFDVVFMDIMLPGMDGLQALEHIRHVEQRKGVAAADEVKAIITTALDDDSKASRAYIHGKAVSYITKPVREEKVQSELRNFGLMD